MRDGWRGAGASLRSERGIFARPARGARLLRRKSARGAGSRIRRREVLSRVDARGRPRPRAERRQGVAWRHDGKRVLGLRGETAARANAGAKRRSGNAPGRQQHAHRNRRLAVAPARAGRGHRIAFPASARRGGFGAVATHGGKRRPTGLPCRRHALQLVRDRGVRPFCPARHPGAGRRPACRAAGCASATRATGEVDRKHRAKCFPSVRSLSGGLAASRGDADAARPRPGSVGLCFAWRRARRALVHQSVAPRRRIRPRLEPDPRDVASFPALRRRARCVAVRGHAYLPAKRIDGARRRDQRGGGLAAHA